MSSRQTLSVVVEAWWMAWQRRRPAPGLIHHSDQGNQYRATLYQTILARRGVVVSMSRKGNCYDTAPVESFFSSLKNELVRHRQFRDQAEARSAIAEYIERFYNRQRCIKRWAIVVRRSSRKWSVSLNPGVRYVRAIST
jgi:transposase InsO family protein